MENIATLLPVGEADPVHHRGARRRSQRWNLDAEVVFVEPRPIRGIALNASAGGMRVAAYEPIANGESCLFEVVFANDRRLVERARVVWSRPLPDGCLLGLEFC